MNNHYLIYMTTVRDQIGVSNNEFILCAEVLHQMEFQNSEWYICPYGKLGITAFLQCLSKFINVNFSSNATGNLILRLQERGILEIDMVNFRIRVCAVFKTAIQNARIGLNDRRKEKIEEREAKAHAKADSKAEGIVKKTTATKSDEAVTPPSVKMPVKTPEQVAFDEKFSESYLPKTENVATFKTELIELIDAKEAAGDKVKLTKEQETFLRNLAKILYPSVENERFAENALRSLHKQHHGRYLEALKNYTECSLWQIDVEMSEKEYLNKLNSTVIWLSVAKRHKIVDFTEKDNYRLQTAIAFVGTKKNDPTGNTAAALAHFRTKKQELIEQQKQAKTDNTLTQDEKVLEALKKATHSG